MEHRPVGGEFSALDRNQFSVGRCMAFTTSTYEEERARSKTHKLVLFPSLMFFQRERY